MKLESTICDQIKKYVAARNWAEVIRQLPEGAEKWKLEEYIQGNDVSRNRMFAIIERICGENEIF